MEMVNQLFDLFLHLDQHLNRLTLDYGAWIYLLLFVIVFCETGLVVTPFLPGDSLLFTAGALASLGSMWVPGVILVLIVAAVLGDSANYWIGYHWGLKVAERFVKKQHLDRTHEFYERYGGKTIIIARFVPIIRTFAPFVAGLGCMTYSRFMSYNVIGGVAWVLICVLAGYFFGNLPFVKQNFSLVILAIIVISVMPAVFEVWRARRRGGVREERPSSAAAAS
jgi:membrane-associated protein